MRIALLAGLFALAYAQEEQACEGLKSEEEARAFCGEQTQHAAKCLTPCFQEAQACFKKVGTRILDIQTCMLDLGDENRSTYCNSCINQQINAQCDVLFECIRNQEGDDDDESDEALLFEQFTGFKRYCQAQSSESSCKDSGCHMNKRGCRAKYGLVSCNRVKIANICDAIPGCKTRKRGANKRGQICKGTPTWAEPEKRNKKN